MTPDLREVGEKPLLASLQRYLGKSKKIIRTYSEDCAVVASGGQKYQLFTIDVLVEGVHFQREYTPAYYIGRKGLKVSISDICAMGGVPLYFLLSLGAPPDTPVRIIEGIYEGFNSVAHETKIQFLGGNLSSSPVLFLDVVVIGEAKKKSALFRSTARKGDLIFVTGALGAAAEGLKLLQDGFRLVGDEQQGLIMPVEHRDSHFVRDAILSHMDPPLLTHLAQTLARTNLLHSLIDLSDGVASDLREVCRESKVGAVIELPRLPIAAAALYWERKRNLDPCTLALHGGEDYHLLLTISPRSKRRLLKLVEEEGFELFEIGRIVDRSEGIFLVDEDGRRTRLGNGYQHFRT